MNPVHFCVCVFDPFVLYSDLVGNMYLFEWPLSLAKFGIAHLYQGARGGVQHYTY